ncbi:hypothetical protein GC170_00850 [bacterium]|nr:hypothetical protein [bacterium]
MSEAPEPESALRPDTIVLPQAVFRIVELQDRLAHVLVPITSGDLLRSVDLDPAEQGLGPTSPVFQESHVEKDAASLRLMLVGQWAKVHFSAVIEHRFDRPDELRFGIAARVRQPAPIRLGSTYTLFAVPVQIRAADTNCVEIAVPDSDVVLRIEAAENSRLALAEAGRSALRLQVTPAQNDPAASETPLPARTLQWDYVVRWVKPA